MLKRFFNSKSATGIECVLLPDGKPVFNLLTLVKNKSKLLIEKSCLNSDFETVRKLLSSKIPVLLVINGKGVIHKKVFVSDKDDHPSLLHKIFPNANPLDFYLQRSVIDSKSNAFVSIVRKNITDEIIGLFTKAGLYVVSCTIGPFILSSILPLLNEVDNKDLLIGNHKILIRDGVIDSYQQTDFTFKADPVIINGESVENELVLSFASALSYFSGFTLDNNIAIVKTQREELIQKNIFHYAGWSVLVFFFFILLVNYFLFDYYDKKKKEYVSQVAFSGSMLAHHDSLKKQIEAKQYFLEGQGLLETSRSSFYADRLAADIPGAIQLLKMNVFPVIKKQNENEGEVEFLQKRIQVAGSCKRSIELNEWMNSVKKKEWVKDIVMLNYMQDKSQELAEFSIEIIIK